MAMTNNTGAPLAGNGERSSAVSVPDDVNIHAPLGSTQCPVITFDGHSGQSRCTRPEHADGPHAFPEFSQEMPVELSCKSWPDVVQNLGTLALVFTFVIVLTCWFTR